MYLLTAILVGFLGSFHCAGMCGPIALALPVNHDSKSSIIIGRLLYNAGRIMTYALLGLLVGLIGHRIALAGFQKTLSITSGLLIIVTALITLFLPGTIRMYAIISKYSMKIKSVFRKLFGKKSRTTLFLIGSVNGLLPCGFVYLSLAAALSAGNFLQSTAYMTLFGIGTFPMMFGISFAGNFFGLAFSKHFRKFSPYVAMIVAILLIYRGMTMADHPCCHHT